VAGNRTVALSGWLVEELKAHRERTPVASAELIFATRTGRAMNPANVRRDVWTKVVKRAGVRSLDMYSLRHTFASFGRVAGESAFNVARAMGHSRSMLVDQVYAHSLQSGMAVSRNASLPWPSASSQSCALSRADSETLDSRSMKRPKRRPRNKQLLDLKERPRPELNTLR